MNIIVSGASRGIGKELSLQASKAGHNVLALARTAGRLSDLAAESKLITPVVIDLMEGNVAEVVDNWVEVVGKVDILINNAGQLLNKPFVETSVTEFRDQFDANVITAVKLSKAVVANMDSGAHILNVTSMGGFQGSSKYPGLSAYSSSKGALSVLTECLAEEFKEYGIAVNALALGAVQTEMLESAFPGYAAPVSASEMATYIIDFSLKGHKYYNGQILPVAIGNP